MVNNKIKCKQRGFSGGVRIFTKGKDYEFEKLSENEYSVKCDNGEWINFDLRKSEEAAVFKGIFN